ncbi:zinc finger CCCH domain-containing protein 42-like [Daucus carota subsp. sativus]|uniref:zinc finger CCCH domain-containing protein 42-like n=1 Tax=Daucus carota subsp. sativus TaxID=79200 RepID=UPI00308318F1
MEGTSNKSLRFGTINFSDYQGLEVLGYKKDDVLSQELQNSAMKDLVNENEDARGGPMVSKDGDRKQTYPLRREVKNCFYFVNYGWCMYGSNCKFNHPYNQLAQGCLNETVVAPVSDFNFTGRPVPQGAKECPHYRQNGSCQYGLNCWFDNSEPSSMEGGFLHSGYTGLEDTMQCSWSFTAPVNEIGLGNPYMYQQEQIFPSSEWSGNQTSFISSDYILICCRALSAEPGKIAYYRISETRRAA